jgi:hypothetical protein
MLFWRLTSSSSKKLGVVLYPTLFTYLKNSKPIDMLSKHLGLTGRVSRAVVMCHELRRVLDSLFDEVNNLH